MLHAKAASIATAYLEMVTPFCHRVMIAGSIRRQKPEVKDIELVVAPKLEEMMLSAKLFDDLLAERGNTLQPRNLLWEWAVMSGILWIKPGTQEIIEWPIKPEGRYWRGVITAGADSVKLDVFLTTPENFGTTLLIRTGSSEFNQALMAHARMIHRPCMNNRFHNGGEPEEFEEEYDVFDFLGLEYVEPNQRIDGSALHQKKGARQWQQAS